MPQKNGVAPTLAEELRAKQSSGEHHHAKLKTDERVLARVTDGIYRQPASALRELISNAYDADAANVWIDTDAPRFQQIVISDDGNGMTLEALANLIEHIGGSPKRTALASTMGLARPGDESRSPGGRKLIGKIGIGLFAVAQLTRHFQIVTKREGDKHRLVADILLKTYSEDTLANIKAGDKATFDTGDVDIWSEKASDQDAHGTQVVLLDLKDYARGLLQSRDRWQRDVLDGKEADKPFMEPPAYHIGSIDLKTGNTRQDDAKLPWDQKDEPAKRFQKLYQAILDEVGESTSDPSVEEAFDYYLQMLWTLALSAPLEYVTKHPFDLGSKDGIQFFSLSNVPKGQAAELKLTSAKKTVRAAAGLTDPGDQNTPFNVHIDGVQLLRPIRFTDLPTKSSAAFTKPMLFAGKCEPALGSLPSEVTGGAKLSFEAYFFWSPKVVPKENNGILVRIAGSSGTLFDDSFMHYEIAEQTRLRQITAEVFVLEGLDAALNIDRESFNYSHPHYQFLARWVHRALRQVTNKHKELGSAARQARRGRETETKLESIQEAVSGALSELGEEAPASPTPVEFEKSPGSVPDKKEKRKKGTIVFQTAEVFRDTTKSSTEHQVLEEKMKAVAQILDAYGILENLDYDRQATLLRAICNIFLAGGGS